MTFEQVSVFGLHEEIQIFCVYLICVSCSLVTLPVCIFVSPLANCLHLFLPSLGNNAQYSWYSPQPTHLHKDRGMNHIHRIHSHYARSGNRKNAESNWHLLGVTGCSQLWWRWLRWAGKLELYNCTGSRGHQNRLAGQHLNTTLGQLGSTGFLAMYDKRSSIIFTPIYSFIFPPHPF